MPETKKSIMEEFVEEAFELLDEMEGSCSNLNGGQDHEHILLVLERGLHTIKGNANAIRLSNYSLAAGRVLDIIKCILGNSHSLLLEPADIDLVSHFVNQSRSFLSAVREHDTQIPESLEDLWLELVEPAPSASIQSQKALWIEEIVSGDAAEKPEPDLLAMMMEGDLTTAAIPKAENNVSEPEFALAYGYAFEALCASGAMDELRQYLKDNEPGLLASLHRISDILASFGQRALAVKQRPLGDYLEPICKWGEKLAESLGSRISVSVLCEDILVLPVVGDFICGMIREVFNASLPLHRRGEDRAFPVSILAEQGESLKVRISGFPGLMHAITSLRTFTLQRRMEGIRGRIGQMKKQDEIELEFPSRIYCLDILVAGTRSTNIGIPWHRVLDVVELPSNHTGSFEWRGQKVVVLDLTESPRDTPPHMVLLAGGSGILGVVVDSIIQCKEMLVKPDINEHPGVVILGFCISVEDGERIPLLNPCRPAEEDSPGRGF
ncbi:MAG: hypothetical protein ACYS8W_13405 [Planctomycetota bacterium]|jgi:chemotaxis protein histidine kinase CheA